MLDLNAMQREHYEWALKNFKDAPSWHSLLGVAEEVGELCHAHLKSEQGIRHTPDEAARLKRDAVGDIVIFLMDYCNREGIVFEDAVQVTWNGVKRRDWNKERVNGRLGK